MAEAISMGNLENFEEAADSLTVMNDPAIEVAWMKKTVEHMEVHFNLLCAVPPRTMKLTAHDDELYNKFKSHFPDFNVEVIEIEHLKSDGAKEKWRQFHDIFKEAIHDASFGTMLRIDCRKDYSEENSVLVFRVQFLAIEVARNREGYNDSLRSTFKSMS